MIYAGIVAGGTGSRMGTDIPKQFLCLKDKPIIIHAILKFLSVSKIDKIYIAVHPDWIEYTNDLLSKHLESTDNICVIEGGIDRNSTVFNIINYINENIGISDDDIILTHDAVRPFVSEKIILDNIKGAKRYSACTTAISAVDTILQSSDNTVITKTPPRKQMYHAQTPQSFSISYLIETYNTLTDDEKSSLTDTCSIFTAKKIPVYIVNGDVSNFKITTPFDLKIAQAVIE